MEAPVDSRPDRNASAEAATRAGRFAAEGSRARWAALGVLAAASAAFAARQNLLGALGGPISLAKVLYLNFALAVFYVLPFFLWRNRALSRPMRLLWGAVLLSFAARGAFEAWAMAALRWRCVYGIGHDLFTLLLAGALRAGLPEPRTDAERRARSFLTLYQLELMTETLMAWRFSLVGDPSRGVYYAAPTARFAVINRLTWIADILLYGRLAWLLRASRDDFR